MIYCRVDVSGAQKLSKTGAAGRERSSAYFVDVLNAVTMFRPDPTTLLQHRTAHRPAQNQMRHHATADNLLNSAVQTTGGRDQAQGEIGQSTSKFQILRNKRENRKKEKRRKDKKGKKKKDKKGEAFTLLLSYAKTQDQGRAAK